MRFRAAKFIVDDKDPFKNDLLNRQESIEHLTNLLKNADDSLVISISGQYGSGKTTFLEIWKKYLEMNDFSTIYFNAWENDFSENALVTFLGELNEGIDKLAEGDKKKGLKETLGKLKSFGSRIILKSLPLLARIGTAGLLDLKDRDIESALSGFSESVVNDEISRYQQSKKNLISFRNELNNLAQELSGDANRKLVIIIDELDRCRPSFAIEILEVAKHFFTVPNIAFVLGVDKKQLGHSLTVLYGSGIDENGYLRRIIDLDYLLPNPDLNKFVDQLFLKFDLEKKFLEREDLDYSKYDIAILKAIFCSLFTSMQIPLRTQEKCMSQVSVAILTTERNEQIYPFLFGTLLCIKVHNTKIYEEFIANRDSEAAIKYLYPFFGRLGGYPSEIIEFWFRVSVMDENTAYSYDVTLTQVAEGKYTTETLSQGTAISIRKYLTCNNLKVVDLSGCLDKVISKIEISSQFSIL